MKKRALTLIEIMIALGIASLLLGILFPYLAQSIKMKKRLDEARAFVYSKAHLQQRLTALFALSSSMECNENKLFFKLNQSKDYDPHFQKDVVGTLSLKKNQLCLDFFGEEKSARREILFEGIESIEFEFFQGGAKGLIDQKEWKTGIPLFIQLTLKFSSESKESFYFRLNGDKRISYPKELL